MGPVVIAQTLAELISKMGLKAFNAKNKINISAEGLWFAQHI